MRSLLPLLGLAALASCGSEATAPEQNDAARVTQQIERQAQDIVQQAEERTGAVEKALENEGATIFNNRDRLLNESAPDATQSSAARNRSR